MAVANLAAALRSGEVGASPADDGRICENIVVTGDGDAVAGDQLVWESQFVPRPEYVEGPFSYTISGRNVTLTALSNIGAGVVGARIIGLA
jgi:hypothetical protein